MNNFKVPVLQILTVIQYILAVAYLVSRPSHLPDFMNIRMYYFNGAVLLWVIITITILQTKNVATWVIIGNILFCVIMVFFFFAMLSFVFS